MNLFMYQKIWLMDEKFRWICLGIIGTNLHKKKMEEEPLENELDK